MARGRALLAVIVAGVIAACGVVAPSPTRSRPPRTRSRPLPASPTSTVTAEPWQRRAPAKPSASHPPQPEAHAGPRAAEANRRDVR